MIRTRQCQRCQKHTAQEVCRRISKSGSESFGWWCLTCLWWVPCKTGGIWISKDTLINYGIDLAEIRTADSEDQERCVACGKRGAEIHHWAPRALFKDADHWPKDYLCFDCHRRWHEVVTPSLVR